MKRILHRRGFLCTGLALGVSLCAPTARACEYCAPNLRVSHPWTRATAKGATVAVVCMEFDEVTLADRLIAVETPVATSADIGGVAASSELNFHIPVGQVTSLSEEGSYLRLVGLKFPLEVARSYPLRLVFEKGGVVEATLNVDYDEASGSKPDHGLHEGGHAEVIAAS